MKWDFVFRCLHVEFGILDFWFCNGQISLFEIAGWMDKCPKYFVHLQQMKYKEVKGSKIYK